VFCLKFLKPSSTLISWIIWSLILFSLITSMAFDVRGQLVTYSPILLINGLLPLGTSGSLVWWRLTYPRLLTGYGLRRCSLSSLPLGLLLLFAYSCLDSSQIVPFQNLLIYRLLLSLLIVMFLRVLFYLLHYSYFSSTTSSAVLLTLFILMPTTQLSILVYNSPTPFFPIW